MCVSNGKCVEAEVESSENKLEVENCIRKWCHVKYTLHVTVLVIVFSRCGLDAFMPVEGVCVR